MGELPYIIGTIGLVLVGIHIVLGVVYFISRIIVDVKELIDNALIRRRIKTNLKTYPTRAKDLNNIILFYGFVLIAIGVVGSLIVDYFFN